MTADTDTEIRLIYERWHDTVRSGDFEGCLALYAEDAILETPLAMTALPGKSDGILNGKTEIRKFFEAGSRKLQGTLPRLYRTGVFFTNGKQLTWEYPRNTPNGNQVDLVEMMDVANGLIINHRVYWGWFGVNLLLNAASKKAPG
jgi:steroid delta-isomerase